MIHSPDAEIVGPWLGIPRPRAQQTLCDSNILFMKESIRLCEEVCCHSTFADHTPTRLIDVEPDLVSGAIRLVDTKDLVKPGCEAAPRYAALSYCWGTPEDAKTQLRTTTATLAAHKAGISEGLMTRVLLEAVQVCRSVSIRYLWVDSLCIIQDDESDWQLESSVMCLVYNNAIVTIVVLSSRSCHESFLTRHIDHISIPFTSRINPEVVGHIGLYAAGPTGPYSSGMLAMEGSSLQMCPWTFRGWTYQETTMSRSQILFGKNFIHCFCTSRIGRENGSYGKPDWTLYSFLSQPAGHKKAPVDQLEIYDAWDDVLCNFLPRKLTHVQDKLPAISGLAKCFAELAHDAYLAGLWRSDLPFGLLWFLRCTSSPRHYANLREFAKQARKPEPYTAPSWSPVCLATSSFETTSFERGIEEDYLLRPDFSPRCSVSEAWAKVEGLNPFGQVSGGSIRIRGRFGQVPSDLLHLYCKVGTYAVRYLVDEGHLVAYCNVDCWNDEEVWPKDGFALLLLGTSRASASYLAKSHLLAGKKQSWHCNGWKAKLGLQMYAERGLKALYPTAKQLLPSQEHNPSEATPDEENSAQKEARSDNQENCMGHHTERSQHESLESTISSNDTCVLCSAASLRETTSDHGKPDGSSFSQSGLGDTSPGDDGSEARYHPGPHRISCPIDEAFDDIEADWFDNNEDAWGLLLAPAAEDGKYIRVGAWRSIVGDGGGSRYFDKYETHEVEIV